ncbi:MAG: FeoB-associated Cys-rich membrane protein [Christensenella sp.]|nr:FeoB-associated Cys-rich membrane protein [Christensenella sp.]
MADWILGIAIVVAIAAVVWYLVKKRKRGECVGCSECNRSRSCESCPHNLKPPEKK